MASRKLINSNGTKIKLSSFERSTNGKYTLALKFGTREEAYQVRINDRNGIFALDLPTRLALKLREFPVQESRALIADVKKKHKSMS
jgi:hypothetical protein